MLWSLIKIILFVVAVAALAWGEMELMQTVGFFEFTGTINGQEYTLGPLESAIGIVVLLIAVWVILKALSLLLAIWHFLL